MDKQNELAVILRRISKLRSEMVTEYPFFGRLLLHLTPAVATCGTACTDMEKLIFDPIFVQKLSDEEFKFVMLHEVMHCVLKHCVRGRMCNQYLYNIACDIVVNSLIFEAMGVTTFTVDGEEPMHLTPDAHEGRDFTAEEVYDMLLQQNGGKNKKTVSNSQDSNKNSVSNCDSNVIGKGIENNNASGKDTGDYKTSEANIAGSVDSHDIWNDIKESDSQRLTDIWGIRIHTASKKCGDGSGVPQVINRYLDETDHMPKTNWKQVLADFIKHDKADYTFQRRDPLASVVTMYRMPMLMFQIRSKETGLNH